MGVTQYDKSLQSSSALIQTIGLSSHGAQEWIFDVIYNAQNIDTNHPAQHPAQHFVFIFCIKKGTSQQRDSSVSGMVDDGAALSLVLD
jgi:hypothetical protein